MINSFAECPLLLITPRQNYIYWNEEATFAVAAAPKVQSAIAAQWQKFVYRYGHGDFDILNMTKKKYVGSALLPSPKLVINDAEIDDSGRYRLRVRIREGWCYSDRVSLEVRGSK